MLDRIAQKVLLIGWEAAEWEIIGSLVDQGDLPHLSRMIRQGVTGRMSTLDPPISSLAWTSVATGKLPEEHRVLGLQEPAENGRDAIPVRSGSRQGKAIWNILSECDLQSIVVGWHATMPAEAIFGTMVSNGFALATGDLAAAWPLDIRAVHPNSLRETVAELRMHPNEVTTGDLACLVPDLDPDISVSDPRLRRAAQAIAETTSRHSVATYLMENTTWDFAAITYGFLDSISRDFMAFHPPRLPTVHEDD